jgi:hypothetical protein
MEELQDNLPPAVSEEAPQLQPQPESQPTQEILPPEPSEPALEPALTQAELEALKPEELHLYNVKNAICVQHHAKAAYGCAKERLLPGLLVMRSYYPAGAGRPTNDSRLLLKYPTFKSYLEALGLKQRTVGDWFKAIKQLGAAPSNGPSVDVEAVRAQEAAMAADQDALDSDPEESDLQAAKEFVTAPVKRELLASVDTPAKLKAALQLLVNAYNKEYGKAHGTCIVTVQVAPVTPPPTIPQPDELESITTKVGDPEAADALAPVIQKEPEPTYYTVRPSADGKEYQIVNPKGKTQDVRKTEVLANKLCAKMNAERKPKRVTFLDEPEAVLAL